METNIKLIEGVSLKDTSISGGAHISDVHILQQQIINQYQPKAEDPKLPDSWEVPLRNPKFTGRGEKLDEISEILSRPEVHVVACVGLGGVGKTHLVLEYVYSNLKLYSGGTAWFTCSDKKSLIKQFLILGKKLGVLASTDETNNVLLESDKVKELKTWLEEDCRSGWLLVFDDAESYEDVCDMFPNKGGKIIITSRCIMWENKVVLDTFERLESIDYLKKVFPHREDDDAWNKLANVFGDLPLALDRASAYLKENEFISVTKYLELYESRKKNLLHVKMLERNNTRSVYTLYDKTVKKIREQSQLALTLLRSLAFFGPYNIPSDIFEDFVEIFRPSRKEWENIDELFGKLQKYSLIIYNKDEKAFSMNSLLQEVVRLHVIDEKDNILLERTLTLLRLWLSKRKRALMNNKERIRQLAPLFKSLILYTIDFHRQILKNEKILKRITSKSDILWLNWGETFYNLGDFQNILEATNEMVKRARERRLYFEKHKSISYNAFFMRKTRTMSDKLFAQICDRNALWKIVYRRIKADHFDQNMVHTWMILPFHMFRPNQVLSCERLLEKLLQLSYRKSLQWNNISPKALDLSTFELRRKIVRNAVQVISDPEMGASLIEKCCTADVLRQLLKTSESLFNGNDPVVKQLKQKPIENISTNHKNLRSIFSWLKEFGDFSGANAVLEHYIVLDDCDDLIDYLYTVIGFDISHYEKVEIYLDKSEELINRTIPGGSEELFKALKTLGDAYFFTDQIIKAKKTYEKALDVALSIYNATHFNLLKARLCVYMMSYIINRDDRTFSHIKKMLNNNSNLDNTLHDTSIDLLNYSNYAFDCGQETIAVQLIMDLLHLNSSYYCMGPLKISVDGCRALIFILLQSYQSHISVAAKVTQIVKKDPLVYVSFLADVLEIYTLLKLLTREAKCLPYVTAEIKRNMNFKKISCRWNKVTIFIENEHEDEIDFRIYGLFRILKRDPREAIDLLPLLLRKGDILCHFNHFESISDILNELKGLGESSFAFERHLCTINDAIQNCNEKNIEGCQKWFSNKKNIGGIKAIDHLIPME